MPNPEGVRGDKKTFITMKTKLFTLFLAFAASAGMLRAEVVNGTCGADGSNLTWSLNTSTQTLTIEGNGEIADYGSIRVGWAPWHEYKEDVVSVVIGDGVTSIGEYAFSDCSSMTSVTFGQGVTSIKKSAFSDCKILTSVTIPKNVTSIGNNAFAYCYQLTWVTIGSGVKSIGDNAFFACNKMACVYCFATSLPEAGNNAFNTASDQKKCTLYVPQESLELYKNAPVWKNFKSIEPLTLNEGVEDVHSDKARSIKVLRDGQVLIRRSGKTYTLDGREIK
jgi:hypothetical protein